MKRLITIILLLFSISVYAQKEGNVWYFGNRAGVDFNQVPPAALTDGVLSTNEGCASIAGADGKLLFYTDGSTIWNKSHAVMKNGYGLLGNSSSTQSAVVIRWPESLNLYYVFTVGEESGPLNYSEL